MGKKIIIVVLTILFLVSSTCTVIGFLHKNKKSNNVEPVYEIKYKYYLENELVDAIPNNSNKEYQFVKYSCSNNLEGNFDEDTWKFTPKDDKVNSSCSLYFVNKFYNVEFLTTNGISESQSPIKVERNGDASIVINPNEGYEYKNSTCSNNKIGLWDSSKNTFVIDDVTSDIACKIDFEIKKLSVQLQVINGNGSVNDEIDYGDRFQSLVEPNNGYENPKIVCTNNQVGIFEKNQFIMEKLSDNTICKVTFNKIKPVSYKMNFTIGDDFKESITFVSGSGSFDTLAGSTASIELHSSDGKPKMVCENNIVPIIEEHENSNYKYEFREVSSNINCTITVE